eukprot:symbB.v1.2.008952.t1/scaffold508.1/size221222/1
MEAFHGPVRLYHRFAPDAAVQTLGCQGPRLTPHAPKANAVSKLPAIASVVTLASLRRRPLHRPTRCLRFGTGALKDVLSPLLPSATSQLKKLQEVPVLSKKEGKKRLCDLRNQLEPLIADNSVLAACSLLREAAHDGLSRPLLEPWLQQLVHRLLAEPCGSQEFREALLLCTELLDFPGDTSHSEALLSVLIALLVERRELDVAIQVLHHAVAQNRIKMRSFQPLLEAFTELGDTSRFQELFDSVLRPLVIQDKVRLNGSAIQTLLVGFSERPAKQDEVLTLLSKAELELPIEWLERIEQHITTSPKDSGLRAEFTLGPELSIDGLHCRPDLQHLQTARSRAAQLLSKRTLERLEEALQHGGVTCLIDGPNIGYRGAVQRRSMSDGPRKGGAKNFGVEEDEIVENLHAPYFRHDQISVILHQLRMQGEVPLIVMPARYAFAHLGDVRQKDQIGPLVPLNECVRKWLSEQSVFVTLDDEPDDAAWMYATLDAAMEPVGSDRGVFVVTRDKAQNHRSQVWGIRFNEGDRAVELERSWRRWSAMHLRWFAISWADCNHFSQDVTIRVEESWTQFSA